MAYGVILGQIPRVSGGNSIRTCRFVVGTSTAGWTAADCDYLCDGTDDQVEINAAIQALPAAGGEIVILDGTYIISSPILIAKEKVSLIGNGRNTILQRNWDGENLFVVSGIIEISSVNQGSIVSDFSFNGKYESFQKGVNNCVYIKDSKYCIVKNCYFYNCKNGCSVSSSEKCIIQSNEGFECSAKFIDLSDSNSNVVFGNFASECNIGVNLIASATENNIISGNCLINNSDAGIRSSSHAKCNNFSSNVCNQNGRGIFIELSEKNTVSGNICNDNSVVGIGFTSCDNSTVSGNTVVVGSGTSSDYQSSQNTIDIDGDNNLISGNNIMGKNYKTSSGTGNTFVNNKYN